MNTTRCSSFLRAALIAAVLVITGCATPESRINKNPELFASFPLDAQEKIRQGQIDVGFTGDMVKMALGDPNRVYSRQTGTGTLEVWSYTSTTTRTDRQRVQADVRYRDSDGRSRTASDWVWIDVPRDTEFERIKVEFVEGKVSAIETLQQ